MRSPICSACCCRALTIARINVLGLRLRFDCARLISVAAGAITAVGTGAEIRDSSLGSPSLPSSMARRRLRAPIAIDWRTRSHGLLAMACSIFHQGATKIPAGKGAMPG